MHVSRAMCQFEHDRELVPSRINGRGQASKRGVSRKPQVPSSLAAFLFFFNLTHHGIPLCCSMSHNPDQILLLLRGLVSQRQPQSLINTTFFSIPLIFVRICKYGILYACVFTDSSMIVYHLPIVCASEHNPGTRRPTSHRNHDGTSSVIHSRGCW